MVTIKKNCQVNWKSIWTWQSMVVSRNDLHSPWSFHHWIRVPYLEHTYPNISDYVGKDFIVDEFPMVDKHSFNIFPLIEHDIPMISRKWSIINNVGANIPSEVYVPSAKHTKHY